MRKCIFLSGFKFKCRPRKSNYNLFKKSFGQHIIPPQLSGCWPIVPETGVQSLVGTKSCILQLCQSDFSNPWFLARESQTFVRSVVPLVGTSLAVARMLPRFFDGILSSVLNGNQNSLQIRSRNVTYCAPTVQSRPRSAPVYLRGVITVIEIIPSKS